MSPATAHALKLGRVKGTTYRDSKGIYSWKDERFPSVTTILKMKDKPALPRWASKSVAEYVCEYITRCGEERTPWSEITATLTDTDHLKNVPWSYAEKKRDMGSTFHDVADSILTGIPISAEAFSEDIRGLIVSLKNWLEKSGAEVEATEFACFNREHGFAGTCDALVRLNGEMFVLDFKTGKDSFEEHALQLAAYRKAEFIGLQDGSEIPMPETVGGLILLPCPEGGPARLLEWPTGEQEFTAFVGLIDVFNWSKTRPKYQERKVA